MGQVDGVLEVYPGDHLQTGGSGERALVGEVALRVERQQDVETESQVQARVCVRKLYFWELSNNLRIDYVVTVCIFYLEYRK